MSLSIIIVLVILLIAIVGTLFLAGKGDEDYRNATKRNTTNLTLIYVVVILFSFIAVGVYIKWFV
ncbi:hypothetical protein [Mesobacillus maritimus]|uniref:Group-specific protein n=1 Tax=Mesobacillus maritimus TaxID=1643336 RepID=A0ABS7K492_9BACI|nr:hypothetical protein [Mesobacillus maritimus]MBY0097074.1 hypothetical protein [Mesobacillus maritimus]